MSELAGDPTFDLNAQEAKARFQPKVAVEETPDQTNLEVLVDQGPATDLATETSSAPSAGWDPLDTWDPAGDPAGVEPTEEGPRG